jgi:hypothetical protein
MRWPLSRRGVLKHLGSSMMPGIAWAEFAGRPALGEEVCVDPAKMDSGAAALRASLNYAEASSDPAKTCAACAFFSAGRGACGSCQIFSGPANAKGHCDSWGPKG